jgi:hypothetical protein
MSYGSLMIKVKVRIMLKIQNGMNYLELNRMVLMIICQSIQKADVLQ